MAEIKEYGPPDPDTTAADTLKKLIEGQDVKYILHHARKPMNARACQLPGSVTVQAVLNNSTAVITVRQHKPGAKAYRVTS